MKIRIFVLLGLCVLGVMGVWSLRPPTKTPLRVVDRCPQEVRPGQEKKSAQFHRVGDTWTIMHPDFGFTFALLDEQWRFEENTIQDLEEPISTPGYLYTFHMTDKRMAQFSDRPRMDGRMLVYLSLCNSIDSWSDFFVSQGWKVASRDIKYTSDMLWTKLTRSSGGRNMEMFITNQRIFQYAFIFSSVQSFSELEKDGLAIVKSVVMSEGDK